MNNRILQEKIEDISSFLEYAARGFISLDRVEGENGNVYYQIIAFPKNGEIFENEELVNLMPLLEADEIIIDK